MKQADYRSPEFFTILNVINSILVTHDISAICSDAGKIMPSKYNVGSYGNKYMWRITNKECPDLLNATLMFEIKATLANSFPQYVSSKIITIGNPAYTKDAKGEPMASIVIMLTELPDNVITKQDLLDFKVGNKEVIEKCLEIESRMFRRDTDNRDPVTRIEDFSYALIYEPRLLEIQLDHISGLTLLHQDNVVTLETDHSPDFSGEVLGEQCLIEGKSTRDIFDFTDSTTFAVYIKSRLESGSLGSLHNAKYCLFVIKATGQVICFEVASPENNCWLAGNIN